MKKIAPLIYVCFALFGATSTTSTQAEGLDLTKVFQALKNGIQDQPPASQENLRIENERYERQVKEYAEYQANREHLEAGEEAAKQAKAAQQEQYKLELRSGKKKPSGLLEAMTAHDANFGTDLASAPKIRPDGKMYAISGIMEDSDGGLNFTALATPDLFTIIDNAKKGIEINQSTYFFVKIPEKMRAEFFDTAKINMRFSIIGKYTANTGYSTVSGQKKSMPVFEAVYWQVN